MKIASIKTEAETQLTTIQKQFQTELDILNSDLAEKDKKLTEAKEAIKR